MTDAVPPNFSIVTLGVTDLERSVRFYTDLGWEQRGNLADGIVWFKTSGTRLGLFGYDALADDAHPEAPPQDELPRYRGSRWRSTCRTRRPSTWRSSGPGGGRQDREAGHPAEWGGYSGYFSDPDGILWEIAYAPGFAVDEHGRIEIP